MGRNDGGNRGGYIGKNSNPGAYRGGKSGNNKPPRGNKRGNAGKSSFASPEMRKAVYITAALPVLLVGYLAFYFVAAAFGAWS